VNRLVLLVALVVLVLILAGASCPPEADLQVSTTDDEISVSAILVENGVMIENTCEVDLLIVVISPEGEQQFELGVGESRTVTDVTPPMQVRAVGG